MDGTLMVGGDDDRGATVHHAEHDIRVVGTSVHGPSTIEMWP